MADPVNQTTAPIDVLIAVLAATPCGLSATTARHVIQDQGVNETEAGKLIRRALDSGTIALRDNLHLFKADWS